ncbi:MAG: DUF4142 domain-containing protein [Luteolibacter sp.]
MKTILFPSGCLAAVLAISSVLAAEDPRVGSLTAEEFKQAGVTAAEQLKALKPDGAQLSTEDKALLQRLVNDNALQAAMSAMAPAKALSAAVKEFAKGESDEQSAMATKLKELATAKGAAAIPNLDATAQKMVIVLGEKTGADFDKAYILTSAVKGHQVMQETLEKIRAEAKDEALRQIAILSLPLVKVHVRIAAEMAEPFNDTVLTPAAPTFPKDEPVPVGKLEGRYGN